MPLVDPSGPRWVKDFTSAREHKRSRGIFGFFERLFAAMFGWMR